VPVLDETALTPCSIHSPAERIITLAKTLSALDRLGVSRVLYSVCDAADRDIGHGRGLQSWCFDSSVNRDAGRLIALRLSKPPFIDGEDGLMASVEGQRAIVPTVSDEIAIGLGFAALTDELAILPISETRPRGGSCCVTVNILDNDGERCESGDVETYALEDEVLTHRESIMALVNRTLCDGSFIIGRLSEVFPQLHLGTRAHQQIAQMTGREPVFRQLLRHLRALNEGALNCLEGTVYAPEGISFSVESTSTLNHGTYGPMRDFPTPDGFEPERWSLHTKLTGGNGARLYFRHVRSGSQSFVLIGYFGDHLPTVTYRT